MNPKNIAYILISYGILSFIFTVNENGIPLILGSLFLLGLGLYLLYQTEPKFKAILHSKKLTSLQGSLGVQDNRDLFSQLPLIPLIASFLLLVSLFLPWMAAKASIMAKTQKSPAIGLFDYDDSIVPTLLIVIALAAAFLAFKKVKFAFTVGLLVLLIGIAYLAGWLGRGAGGTGNYGAFGVDVELSLAPQAGLYLLIIASLVYSATTFKFLRSTFGNS